MTPAGKLALLGPLPLKTTKPAAPGLFTVALRKTEDPTEAAVSVTWALAVPVVVTVPVAHMLPVQTVTVYAPAAGAGAAP